MRIPWVFLVLVAGLILRFGVEGYNTLGNILIVLSSIVLVIGWTIVFFGTRKLLKELKKNPTYDTNFGRKMRRK